MKKVKIDYKLVNKAEIARRLGISQPYIHMLLAGKKSGPRAEYWLKKIEAIAKDTAA
ncbi:MAG: hypothetical protein LC102_09175 [Ignavibacteriales bacterium]|jgi:hypothetical protein|nr:MAG: helix-turn-helix domain-containing protein [Ignavibacteriaceae bacterium]MBW7872866.1 hypothetical protein [Ignavibacteria bacterium]MBZ0197266.1 hypothetical protein [Ignavibacteriaceae bacterium]MCZ2143586.1 hypothetical protein [Ignavibacteriales bacterium]WKZ72092.1 MAG: hypothetical protein QY308_10735 [Ignavibacteriaceae bacterium]